MVSQKCSCIERPNKPKRLVLFLIVCISSSRSAELFMLKLANRVSAIKKRAMRPAQGIEPLATNSNSLNLQLSRTSA